jgi:hypothetical protein
VVKLAAGREQETLRSMERLYREFNEGLPLEYTFLDQDYQVLYAAEARVAVLSRYFAGIAGLIPAWGCSGWPPSRLSGAPRRSHRKVLGASVGSLVPCSAATSSGLWASPSALPRRWLGTPCAGGSTALPTGLTCRGKYLPWRGVLPSWSPWSR